MIRDFSAAVDVGHRHVQHDVLRADADVDRGGAVEVARGLRVLVAKDYVGKTNPVRGKSAIAERNSFRNFGFRGDVILARGLRAAPIRPPMPTLSRFRRGAGFLPTGWAGAGEVG